MELVEIVGMLEMQAQVAKTCIDWYKNNPERWETDDPTAPARIMNKWRKEVEGFSKAAEIVRAAI